MIVVVCLCGGCCSNSVTLAHSLTHSLPSINIDVLVLLRKILSFSLLLYTLLPSHDAQSLTTLSTCLYHHTTRSKGSIVVGSAWHTGVTGDNSMKSHREQTAPD